MKNIIFTICLLACVTITQAQVNNVGIGTTTPDPSAILELQATDQGFLMPRMDQSGENALPSPAQGLMIYNTNVNNAGRSGLRYYDGMLWNSALSQKSSGEIFMDNMTSNYFNILAGSNYEWQIDGTLKYQINATHHTFSNGEITINSENGDGDYLNLKGGDAISAYTSANALKSLNFNENQMVIEANGDVRFHETGADQNIIIKDGNKIGSFGDDGTTRKTMTINERLEIDGTGSLTKLYSENLGGNLRFAVFNTVSRIEAFNSSGNPSTLIVGSSGTDLQVQGDMFALGYIKTGSVLPVINTSATHYDAYVGQVGGNLRVLGRLPSSRRYKENIKKATIDFSAILGLDVKQYNLKKEYGGSPEFQRLGIIAEEADSLGIKDLVVYDPETNLPDGIHYKRIGLHLLPIVKEQDETIKKQKKRIDDLEARLERLEAIIRAQD